MLNKVQIIGHVGADVRVSNTGAAASISIATNSYYTDKQGNKVKTVEWHRVTLFGRLAQIAQQYIRKGSKIYIEGALRTRKYDKNGVDHYITEIIAQRLQMLDSKPADTTSTQSVSVQTQQNQVQDVSMDEMMSAQDPF